MNGILALINAAGMAVALATLLRPGLSEGQRRLGWVLFFSQTFLLGINISIGLGALR